MTKSTFIYAIYIRTTPEKLWSALTDAKFSKEYWFGMRSESEWVSGSPWKLVFPDGRICDAGEIVEAVPPRRLVIRWHNRINPEFESEGPTQCAMELEPLGTAVALYLTHSIDYENSKYISAASGVWPKVISNLKSLLETGTVVFQSY
jgi:uncharacterized protein YndB with AHSA1/START domain